MSVHTIDLRRDANGALNIGYFIHNLTADGVGSWVVDVTLPGVGTIRRLTFAAASEEELRGEAAAWVLHNYGRLLVNRRTW